MNGHGEADITTMAKDLPDHARRWGIEKAAEVAIFDETVAVLVGAAANGLVLICTNGCCISRGGCYVVIPDTIALEGVANGQEDVSLSGVALRRDDGRTAYLFTGPAS